MDDSVDIAACLADFAAQHAELTLLIRQAHAQAEQPLFPDQLALQDRAEQAVVDIAATQQG